MNLPEIYVKKVYEKYPYDGKVQVTLNGDNVETVVVSFQNSKNKDLLPLVKNIISAKGVFNQPSR